MFTLTQTAVESIVLNSDDGDFPASRKWELIVEVTGVFHPEQSADWNTPYFPPHIEILGLEVVEAYCYDWHSEIEYRAEQPMLDAIDSLVNRLYWYGIFEEDFIENKTLAMILSD